MDETPAHTEIFRETQQMSPQIQALVYGSTLIAGVGGYLATKETPGAEIGLYIILGSLVFITIFFRSFTLETTATDAGIRVKGMWFVNRLIKYSDIGSAEMRQYKPIMEYGGWGYRIGPSGKAYNAQGDEGVQLQLTDGGRVLIGSQRALELAQLIDARIKR